MPRKTLKTLSHAVYNMHAHLVMVTKYRHDCLTAPMLDRLREITQAAVVRWGFELLEFNGEADHVHMLLGLNPKVAPSAFVNNLKTTSARLLRKEFAVDLKRFYWGHDGLWSRSYCLVTAGGAPLSVLKAYIEQQKAPH